MPSSAARLEVGLPATRQQSSAPSHEATLVERARDGDRRAFEQLVESHLGDLFRLAAGMVGEDDARDVAQEALVTAWRELPTLRQIERFEPWLRSILMNRARNVLRSRRRRPQVAFDPALGHGRQLVDEPVAGLHRRWVMEDALATVRPEDRAVIVLHYVADLTLREVAETLGVREGTAKSRLHAGLRALRMELGEEPA
jgi:RNA polymerase sigma-70 factor (ECF subfamily)